MAWITDSLRGALAAINPFARGQGSDCLPFAFSHQLAIAAYMSSGMLRKVIAVPAEDRVREWRDWQADKEHIAAIEKEERRLGLVAKVRFAEVLRGIGGGALILIAPGPHDRELRPEQIAKGGLIAINVVSRWQLQGLDWINNLADPDHGCPRMFQVNGEAGAPQKLHPSRVVCFRGDPVPAGPGVSQDDAFWGDSRLLRVYREVEKADNAHLWFAQLVRKAKLLRIGIPDLDSMDETRINKRITLIAEGEGILNATVYRSTKNQDDQGEKIDDYQVNWTGMPAMMDAFDQRVAAVGDIPFTRLQGRSPAGMNSTGEHDTDNWNKSVAAGQELETRPCLEKIDEPLIRSAGVDPAKVTWAFAPLDVPSEKVQADTFFTTTQAIEKLQNTGTIPDEALSKGVQNLMVEREWMPGLDQALAEIPEDERYGAAPDPNEPDPSALQAANENGVQALEKRGAINADQAALLLTDAAPRSLYVSRKLLNAAEFIAWAKSQGFETTTPADEPHVTICYSRQPVDWLKMGEAWDWNEPKDGKLVVSPGGARIVDRLGDKGAVVLLFTSSALSYRHGELREKGASYDFEDYQPHVTITYSAPAGLDLAKIEPFRGKLIFGPEIFEEIADDWASGITEEGGRSQATGPFADAKRRGRGLRSARTGRHSGFDPTQPRGRDGRWIPAGTRHMIDEARAGRTSGKAVRIGSIGANARARLHGLGHDVSRKDVSLDPSNVRHTHVAHGAEQRRGHRPVTGEDIATARYVLNNAARYRASPSSLNGLPRVLVSTRLRQDHYFAIFEVRRKTIALVTMWIRR